MSWEERDGGNVKQEWHSRCLKSKERGGQKEGGERTAGGQTFGSNFDMPFSGGGAGGGMCHSDFHGRRSSVLDETAGKFNSEQS